MDLSRLPMPEPLKRKVGLPVSEIILESILTSKSGVFEEIPPVKYPRFKGQDRLGIIFRNRQTISTFKMLEYRMVFKNPHWSRPRRVAWSFASHGPDFPICIWTKTRFGGILAVFVSDKPPFFVSTQLGRCLLVLSHLKITSIGPY